jgi:transposase
VLIVFFDMEGVVHYQYVPQGQTVNQQFYLQFLKNLRHPVSRRKPQKQVAGAWALHRDSAPAHTAHSIQVFLASRGIPVTQQPPYSPDMALCDFWLFSQLKTVLIGNRFEDIDTIKKNAMSMLNTIPKDSFKTCLQQWHDRWKKCVRSQGEYFQNY